MSTFVKNLLGENRKRLLGSLMSYLETEVYPHLTEDQRTDLRAKVLQSVGNYHDSCLDLIKASINDGSVQNELVLEAIANMHRDLKKGVT